MSVALGQDTEEQRDPARQGAQRSDQGRHRAAARRRHVHRQQKDQIKTLVEHGKRTSLGAQKLILASSTRSSAAYRKSLRATNDEHAKGAKDTKTYAAKVDDARSAFRDAKNELGKYAKGTDEYREAARKARQRGDDLKDTIRDQRRAMKDALTPVAQLASNVAGLGEVVADVSDTVGGNINDVLGALGAKTLRYTIKHPKKAGSAVGNLAGLAGSIFATGGIPNPGSGARDDHVLLSPDGTPVAAMSGTEGILNTPQMALVDRALAVTAGMGFHPYGGLDALWGSGMRHYAGGGVIGRADQLDRMHLPYVWGGHHGDPIITDPRPGLDCSSAVSYVLNIPPRVSGAFENYGQPGTGPVTIYANPEHVFMSIFGRGFGTSHENPGGGAGWLSYNSRPGFTVRNVSGASAGAFDIDAPGIVGPDGPLKDIATGTGKKLAAAGRKYVQSAVSKFDNPAGQPLNEGTAPGVAGNIALGQRMAASKGWTGAAWNALKTLWNRESGWSTTAQNPTSSAYGIPQDITGNHHGDTARGQIGWGLNYIAGRYGSPIGALAHENSFGWYAGGGKLGKKQKAALKQTRAATRAAEAAQGKFVTQGLRRATSRIAAGTGIGKFEQDISDLETTYGQKDRLFGFTEDDYLIENDDGSTSIDTKAQKHREGELNKLIDIRMQIRRKIVEYQEAIAIMISAYRKAINQLARALKAATGKGRGKERQGYKDLIGDYQDRITELRGTAHDLGFDLKDNNLDIRELTDELDATTGAAGAAAPSDSGTSGTTIGDAPQDNTVAIAEAALAQVQAFQASRADLFSSFGSNFATAGTNPFATSTQQAAGFAYFGAANQPVGSDTVRAAAEGGIHIHVTGQDMGSDPFGWTNQVKHELTAI
jgi:methyl-accepting chemotaxis protein